MLTTDQKEHILLKAGVTLPASLTGSPTAQLQQADGACLEMQTLQADCSRIADEHRTIGALFDAYTARRAAMSLRNGDTTRQAGVVGWGGLTS